jgi:NAD(P)H dehydrogenase (quinone)
MKVFIICYSLYGHIFKMANAVAEGVKETGTEAFLYRVPELLSDEIIEKMGAASFQNEFKKLPVITPYEMINGDAFIFGTPTRFGNMCAQMRAFFDASGAIWKQGGLVGKVGSVFTSSGTQHGGQESTILSMHITLLHHGMIIAGLPYTFEEQSSISEINGCSPYGASTIAGPDGARWPSNIELSGARFQGRYVANITRFLAGKEKELLGL